MIQTLLDYFGTVNLDKDIFTMLVGCLCIILATAVMHIVVGLLDFIFGGKK